VDTLASRDIAVYFVAQAMDSRDPNFRMMMTVFAMGDLEYTRGLREEVMKGRREKVRLGYTLGEVRDSRDCLDQ
jgi:DNA invertase Pin-like site-specific DNA recombinase